MIVIETFHTPSEVLIFFIQYELIIHSLPNDISAAALTTSSYFCYGKRDTVNACKQLLEEARIVSSYVHMSKIYIYICCYYRLILCAPSVRRLAVLYGRTLIIIAGRFIDNGYV